MNPVRIYVASEVRMHLDRQGQVRAKHAAAAYDAWKPFVDAFGSITVVARLDRSRCINDGPLVEGPGVSFHALPYYLGMWRAPLGLFRIRLALRDVGEPSDIFIGRVPELVSFAVLSRARALRARNVVMLVGDPQTIGQLPPGFPGATAVKFLVNMVENAIAHADAVIYVSQQYFQDLYPAPHLTPTLGRSNVVLPQDWLAGGPRHKVAAGREVRLVTVGSLALPTKGMDFLLSVVEDLSSRGHCVTLTIVGSGRLEYPLRAEAARRGLKVRFTGQVHDRLELRRVLDESDIYVSGSRSEGLPRATIEAMARALPIVSTNAGAASEVVSPRLLVPVGDVNCFADAVEFLLDSPSLYFQESGRSLDRAKSIAAQAAPERLTRFLQEHLVSCSDLS